MEGWKRMMVSAEGRWDEGGAAFLQSFRKKMAEGRKKLNGRMA